MTDKQKLDAIRAEIHRLVDVRCYDRKMANDLFAFMDSLQEEPVSEDFKEFEVEYFEREKDNIVCVYDRHAGLVDGANWQKEQMMKDAVNGLVVCNNLTHGFKDIVMKIPSFLNVDDKVKVIILKED